MHQNSYCFKHVNVYYSFQGGIHDVLQVLLFSLLFSLLWVAAAFSNNNKYVDIRIDKGEEHEVRFTSGKTIYVEGLVNGQWAGRYWAADGRISFPYWKWLSPAFKIGIKQYPSDTTTTMVTNGWQWISSEEISDVTKGARHFIVSLENSSAQLRLRIHTKISDVPVLVRWLEISNSSDKPIAIMEICPWSSRLWDAPPCKMNGPYSISSSFPWMSFSWKTLQDGITTIENQYANGYEDPFFMARSEYGGEYFICHLEWTANYRIKFQCEKNPDKPNAGIVFEMGPRAKDALRVISAGETITTPKIHLGHIAGTLDEAVQAMHEHIRRFVLPPRETAKAWRIQYNTPGDQGYFTGDLFNEENIKKCINVAAEIGSELFLLDCPWYDNYGEWVPSPTRFPNGIRHLVEYSHTKGMLFGLQTEVEGGRCDWSKSTVHREHPEWFADQNIMKLYQKEPAEYMEKELRRVIDTYGPDLYRNEFIPDKSKLYDTKDSPFYITDWMSEEREGFQESCFWRYYENWSDIWINLKKRYLGLILQQCANCGTREDLGTVSLFDETNTSEGPPQTMIGLLAGKTLCIPPEIIEVGYGTAKERGPLDTYLRVNYTLAMPQHVTGIAPTVEEMSPIVREQCLHYAEIYKNFVRPILPVSRVFHHSPSFLTGESPWEDPWFAMEYASPDGNRAWATIVHRSPSPSNDYLLKPRGLRRDRDYQVTYDSTGEKITRSGLTLVENGINLRLESVMSSELLIFEAVSGP